ncbi:MAG: hypothetical protein AB1921_03475 [Thermodesulfobacteriota bacterium]
MKKRNIVSAAVIATTFILFVLALFFKGFTHDLLLEAGVFLVSVKLILMASANNRQAGEIRRDLQEIKQMLDDCRPED